MTAPASPLRFDDGKAPDALRTIGEVASALGIRQHVLRYWEEQFPMLRPLKRSGGRRYYRPMDVALLERIDGLVHRQGYTLRGARLALEGGEVEAPRPAATGASGLAEGGASASMPSASGDNPHVVQHLLAIRNRLAAALG